MFYIFLNIVIFVSLSSVINCLNLCGDWTQNGDKCVKVIEKKATQEEALNNCTHLEQTSTLLTIHSKEEQEFLNKLLLKYNNSSKNIWIGMKYTDKTYRWSDGSLDNFTNWAEDVVRDGTDPCVQMSLVNDSLGKWTVMSCNKPAMIVCQKKQELNFKILQDIIESQSNIIEKLSKTVEVIEMTTVPIGFIYTQLPNQSSPLQLWPNMKWTEVTKQYSGLFFRAEGSGSESFGKIQPANQSSISNIQVAGYDFTATDGKELDPVNFDLNSNTWTNLNVGDGVQNSINIFTTDGETRPRNTAIKLWKRIN